MPWATALSPLGGRPSRSPGRPPVRRPADRRKPWVEREALIPSPGCQPPKRASLSPRARKGQCDAPVRGLRAGAGRQAGASIPGLPSVALGYGWDRPRSGAFGGPPKSGQRSGGCEDHAPQGPCATVGDCTHPPRCSPSAKPSRASAAPNMGKTAREWRRVSSFGQARYSLARARERAKERVVLRSHSGAGPTGGPTPERSGERERAQSADGPERLPNHLDP